MPGSRKRRILLKAFLVLLIIGLGAGCIGGYWLYLYCKPRYEKAQSFNLADVHNLEQASIIFGRDGQEIGRIFVQNREPISIDEVSENFINALVSTEDARYWEHDGVDYVGVVRAAILNFKAGTVTQGASTITQQLARNAFDLRERSISRKAVEAFLAQRIEKEFDKREILELYMNRIYFGSGFYGISAASQGYFGKPASDLTGRVPQEPELRLRADGG